MERQIIFRDYQEQQAQDHLDLQNYARDSIDHVVLDAVTNERKYAGFTVTKTAQTEFQCTAGRFYDVLGAIYQRSTTLTQSVVTYLPAVAQRYIALCVYGTETETDVEERDFLVDVDTGRTEPDAVATVSSRDAVLSIVQGTESADPQYPATPVGSVVIAYILLDTTQIVSVTQVTDNRVVSTSDLDERTDDLEEFEASIGPRVASLASDLAALAEAMKRKAQVLDVSQIYQDLARVKERVELPANYSDYGADRFLDSDDSDTDNSQSLGYDAKVQEGCRFPFANEDQYEPTIFSANDPNAHLSSGLLLPAYDDYLKLEIGTYHSDLGISQYGFQTFDIEQYTVARSRVRYGPWFEVCTNVLYQFGKDWEQLLQVDWINQTLMYEGETYEYDDIAGQLTPVGHLPHYVRLRKFWTDSWVETYWKAIKVEHSITGAQVAQTMLIANDMWLTKIGFYLTAIAANENVYLTLCELTAGVPDLKKALLHQSVSYQNLVANDWTETAVQPTFLKGGTRYALVLTSNANHKLGMAYGQTYVDGTFFYSTDTEYYYGDLTKDMMVRLYGAKFRAPSVAIEFTAMNLDGGIRDVDIMAGMVQPESTQLVLEVQPGGSGEWIPLDVSNLTAFSSVPPLARFRGRFVGTRDMQPAIQFTGSRVTMFRPRTTFKHISEEQTLSGPSSEIHVKVMLENFNEVAHDMSCKLYSTESSPNELDPVLTTTVAIDADAKRYYREFKFTPAEISAFTIELIGSTNSASDTFHVAERIYWAI